MAPILGRTSAGIATRLAFFCFFDNTPCHTQCILICHRPAAFDVTRAVFLRFFEQDQQFCWRTDADPVTRCSPRDMMATFTFRNLVRRGQSSRSLPLAARRSQVSAKKTARPPPVRTFWTVQYHERDTPRPRTLHDCACQDGSSVTVSS